jgi:proline dehydrogenase
LSVFSKAVIALTEAGPVEKTITGTRPGRALAHRFVAGDTLDDAVSVARRLNDDGLVVSLDFLGEEVSDSTSWRPGTSIWRGWSGSDPRVFRRTSRSS